MTRALILPYHGALKPALLGRMIFSLSAPCGELPPRGGTTLSPYVGMLIQKYQTALGILEPERSYTTGNSPPLVSALLAARPQRGVRPFSYVCTDTNQFLVPQLMFSSSAQRGPHAAECDLLKSLAPENSGNFGGGYIAAYRACIRCAQHTV